MSLVAFGPGNAEQEPWVLGWAGLDRSAVFRKQKGLPPERIDPETDYPGVVAHHAAKYAFADTVLGDGRLIDVGCGFGYGTALLQRPGRSVIGMDIAAEAVAVGRARHARARIAFVQADGERFPFRDNVFDGITCFEAIEHFYEPDVHVAEVVRVLNPAGVYVLSTPQPDKGGAPELNPHHRHEFSVQSLANLLEPWFEEVTVLGQRRRQTRAHTFTQRVDVLGLRRWNALRPLARWLSRRMGTQPVETARLEDFVIDEDGGTSGSEFVVLCQRPR